MSNRLSLGRGMAALEGTPDLAVAKWRHIAFKVVPFLLTALMLVGAIAIGRPAWRLYMGVPWTRDATVRAYIVTLAPEVHGRIVALPISDNAFVHRGDLLLQVDPTDYAIAVANAEAQLAQSQADMDNKVAMAGRRQKLTTLSTSDEEKQSMAAAAQLAIAVHHQNQARLAQARLDLERTRIVAPVDGWVTNLQTRIGDYAQTGRNSLSVVDAGSFWIDAYFEETYLASIHEHDPVQIKLMGFDEPVSGHVEGVSRGIQIPNAQTDPAGLATVNPVFTWVRLAQRVPVRVALDHVPADVRLVAGETATVHVLDKGSATRASSAEKQMETRSRSRWALL